MALHHHLYVFKYAIWLHIVEMQRLDTLPRPCLAWCWLSRDSISCTCKESLLEGWLALPKVCEVLLEFSKESATLSSKTSCMVPWYDPGRLGCTDTVTEAVAVTMVTVLLGCCSALPPWGRALVLFCCGPLPCCSLGPQWVVLPWENALSLGKGCRLDPWYSGLLSQHVICELMEFTEFWAASLGGSFGLVADGISL